MTMTLAVPTQNPPGGPESHNGHSDDVLGNPLGSQDVTGVRGGAHMYGACSIESFCNAGALSLTHEDAQGWANYVAQFNALNFRFYDSSVQPWAYYEAYDNWQDTYGVDAVRAFYHSGHGGMDANGVFYAPLGGSWGNEGCTAISSKMRLGNEYLRYIFWSTCLSLRVLDGHSPIRTWNNSTLGLRMIFGFETVSVDDPNYGKFFWEEWNRNGRKLSQAWLDASWRIAHNQAPSVAACGSSAVDAQSRLYNEQYFQPQPVSHDWWWWRWYNAASLARESSRTVPRQPLVANLRPLSESWARMAEIADGLAFGARNGIQGSYPEGGASPVRIGADGRIVARLAEANRSNRGAFGAQRALARAGEAIEQYGLAQNVQLVFDRVMLANEAGGSAAGSGAMEGPFTTETVVQFRQQIDGLPVITPGAGVVRISLDNDGTVTSVQSAVREVEGLSARLQSSVTPPPGSPALSADPRPESEGDAEAALRTAFGRRLASLAVRGEVPVGYQVVPGTTEVGYHIQGDSAALITHQQVEVDFGGGYRKRYWVSAPLVS
ncbi:MAG: DUF6345 domain-containing protein [Chloroflexota bacterium]